MDPSDFHLSYDGITCDEKKKLADYIDLSGNRDLLEEFLLIPSSIAGGGIHPMKVGKIDTKNPHQEMVRVIAELYLNKLINALPKKYVRDILVENNIISKREKAKASKKELLNLVLQYNLEKNLHDSVFREASSGWSWQRELVKILNNYNNRFYIFGKSIFSNRFGTQVNKKTGKLWRNTPYDRFTIEKLIDLFININDPDISENSRTKVLEILNIYARKVGLPNYDTVKNKPIWALSKALQKVLSKSKGKLVSINYLGKKILNDEHAFTFRYSKDRSLNSQTLNKIALYCVENLNKEDLRYINRIIEIVAIANDIIYLTSDNPKKIELELIEAIAEKLSPLHQKYGWKDIIPNLTELEKFFGMSATSLWSKIHISETRLYNIFYEKYLYSMAKKIKKELGPIDTKDCKDLIQLLGNYNPAERQAYLRDTFPTYES